MEGLRKNTLLGTGDGNGSSKREGTAVNLPAGKTMHTSQSAGEAHCPRNTTERDLTVAGTAHPRFVTAKEGPRPG